MKSMILILSMMVFSVANAQGPVDVCGYGKVKEIASINEWGGMKIADLTADEKTYIASQVDTQHDCNEGVEVGGVSVGNNAYDLYIVAVCSADSLGSKAVKLPLTCVETIQ